MRSWLLLLAGLIVWTGHFFAVYAIGEFGGEAPGWRITVGVLTLLGLAAEGGLFVLLRGIAPGDGFERWRKSIALGGVGISAIAVLWQGLPALLA